MDTTATWIPDPETGLSGALYLAEHIEQYVSDISNAHRPGVYVLRSSIPDTSNYGTFAQLWLDEFEAVPEYLHNIAAADKLLYVGAAQDVYSRLESHVQGHQTTAVAEVFPVHSVVGIEWFETAEEAFTHESQIASALQADVDAYVHSR